MRNKIIISLLLSSSLLLVNTQSAEPLKVKPEIFTPTKTRAVEKKQIIRSIQAGIKHLKPAKRLSLPNLSAEEIAKIQPAGKKRPMQVGISRKLSRIDFTALDWTNISTGRIAHIIIQSNQAESLRVLLDAKHIPDGVEIRFFSPSQLNQAVTTYTADSIAQKGNHFWSPSIEGEQIGIEIYLPTSVKPSELELSIPQISHLFQNVSTPLSKSSIPSIRAASESCNINVMCASQTWQDTAKAVAKYIYTEPDGNSYLCSGTLLADTDNSTQIPYFLTANHCINNASSAASMELYWFYRTTQCNSTQLSANFTTTQNGGVLLAHSATSDTSFIKLNTDPPAGVSLSGWTLTPLQSNDVVVGLHHPNGDVKKYSKGVFQHFEKITDLGGGSLIVTPDDNGNFISVVWSEGITAGGSSGSGLWKTEQGVNYLVGALFGGSSFCSAPQAPDDYGRFDRSYPYFSQWLNPTPTQININVSQTPTGATALLDGMLIYRYVQGLRGNDLIAGLLDNNADIASIESNIAAISPHLDIDLDGNITAEQDVMLIIRYMLGLRGSSLTEGIVSANASRTTATEIEQYLKEALIK